MGAQKQIKNLHIASPASMKDSFQLLASLEFRENNVGNAEDVLSTLKYVEDIVDFSEKLLSKGAKQGVAIRKEYPLLSPHPFLNGKQRDEAKKRKSDNEKYDEKLAKIWIVDYQLLKYAAIDAERDARAARILKNILESAIIPRRSAFEQKVVGGNTIAQSIRSKNQARAFNLDVLGANLKDYKEGAPEWNKGFGELAERRRTALSEMGQGKKTNESLKEFLRNKLPKINEEIDLYRQDELRQVELLAHNSTLHDPEAIFDYLLEMWENAFSRMHNVLLNDIKAASLSAAFIDVHGGSVDPSEHFNKPVVLKDQIRTVGNQKRFLERIRNDYRNMCVTDLPLLYTGTFHSPAVAGADYTEYLKDAASPEAAAAAPQP